MIGTGTKLPRPPAAFEVQSTIRTGDGGTGGLEMTADLVVLDTLDAQEEDLEEDEPLMQEAEVQRLMSEDWPKDLYHAQEFEQFSSSAPESQSPSTPEKSPLEAPLAHMQQPGDSVNLLMPTSENHNESEPSAHQIDLNVADQEENEPEAIEILGGMKFGSTAVSR